jgi:hypothetical protein
MPCIYRQRFEEWDEVGGEANNKSVEVDRRVDVESKLRAGGGPGGGK